MVYVREGSVSDMQNNFIKIMDALRDSSRFVVNKIVDRDYENQGGKFHQLAYKLILKSNPKIAFGASLSTSKDKGRIAGRFTYGRVKP